MTKRPHPKPQYKKCFPKPQDTKICGIHKLAFCPWHYDRIPAYLYQRNRRSDHLSQLSNTPCSECKYTTITLICAMCYKTSSLHNYSMLPSTGLYWLGYCWLELDRSEHSCWLILNGHIIRQSINLKTQFVQLQSARRFSDYVVLVLWQ